MIWLNRGLITVIISVCLFISLISCALAQKGCDQFSAVTVIGDNPPVVRVPGVEGQSVYICGYVIIHAGGSAGLEFEITSGTGQSCATDNKVLIPRMPILPGTNLVNRIAYAYGEYTPLGHSLCSQTLGSGQLYTIFYWSQY